MVVEYEDLLGVPYKLHGVLPEGLDCSTLWEEIQRRMGNTPPPTSPFRCAASSGEFGEFENYLVETASRFECLGYSVGKATRCGDFVLLKGGACGVGRGLITLVDPSSGLFLSSLPRTGVTALTRDKVLRAWGRDVLAAYRFLE